MPVSRAFLKPVTVEPPPQGDFEYLPEVVGHESDTLAGLVALINGGVGIQTQDLDNFFVVHSVDYEVVVTKSELGGMPAELLYSALVWYTRVHKV